MWQELLVLDESHICRQHHQCLGFGVLVLLWALPLSPTPLLFQEQLVVVVGQCDRTECPWTFEARAIRMAATESVSTVDLC